MARSRRSATIRAFAILFLVWVGVDFGAHGFSPDDLLPIASGDGSQHVVQNEGSAFPELSPDHCFSHGTFLGAMPTPDFVGLAPSGAAVLARSTGVPDREPHPLDKPPQLCA